MRTLESKVEQLVENAGYTVRFENARHYTFCYCQVFYNGMLIHEKSFHGFKRYSRGAHWAKSQIKDHQKAMEILGGLHSSPVGS